MNLQPRFDRVLIKVAPKTQEKIGAIVMPGDDNKQVVEGTVIGVGEGFKDQPMTIKNGEIVLVQKFSGVTITEDNEEYKIVKQTEILASRNVEG